MIVLKNPAQMEEFVVVHPLYDAPEQKCDPAELGQMKFSPSVRVALLLLRGYLIVMGLMLTYHMLDLAGMFGRHPHV